jgi:vacuolar iron transporter family protein
MSDITNWKEEKRSAYLYTLMTKSETHPLRIKLFQSLAKAAEDQAKIWEKKITASTPEFLPAYTINFRTWLVGWLVKQLGVERMRYVLCGLKVRGMSIFSFTNHEYRHNALLSANNLRAAIFGVNDGLISNMSLILGIIGAETHHSFIVLTGIAGLLAGACSMGAGEYISVKSQRELYEYQIGLERNELKLYPEEEIEELTLIYQARGISKEDAEKLARLLISNPETALDTLAREELGLNPSDLVSPKGAMVSSFLSFSIGAAIPILPFLVGDHPWNITLSITLTAFFLFVIGAMTSLFTNRGTIKSGLRMLIIGTIAGTLTYMIGKFIGVKI